MTDGPRSWEDYFYPLPPGVEDNNPFARVLRNIPGITNLWDLMDFERDATLARATQIATGAIVIERTFDANHYAAIHRALFQDVYEWAGEFRSVDMRKMRPSTLWVDQATPEYETFAPSTVIRESLDFVANEIRNIPWEALDQHGVATALAQTHTQLNYVHPAREGNGRCTRIFIEQLAEHAGYEITTWPDKETYLHAVVEANRGRYTDLTKTLEKHLTPLVDTPQVASVTERARSLSQAVHQTKAQTFIPNTTPSVQAQPPTLRAD